MRGTYTLCCTLCTQTNQHALTLCAAHGGGHATTTTTTTRCVWLADSVRVPVVLGAHRRRCGGTHVCPHVHNHSRHDIIAHCKPASVPPQRIYKMPGRESYARACAHANLTDDSFRTFTRARARCVSLVACRACAFVECTENVPGPGDKIPDANATQRNARSLARLAFINK